MRLRVAHGYIPLGENGVMCLGIEPAPDIDALVRPGALAVLSSEAVQ